LKVEIDISAPRPAETIHAEWVPGVVKGLEALTVMGQIADAPVSAIRANAVMFLADVAHLNEYGRSIYGENWGVRWHGPVGSVIDGLLRRDVYTLAFLDLDDRIDMLGTDPAHRVDAGRAARRDKLSQTDEEAIRAGIEMTGGKTDRDIVSMMRGHEIVSRATGGRILPWDMVTGSIEDVEAGRRNIQEIIGYEFF
jgi:hypothetical protein